MEKRKSTFTAEMERRREEAIHNSDIKYLAEFRFDSERLAAQEACLMAAKIRGARQSRSTGRQAAQATGIIILAVALVCLFFLLAITLTNIYHAPAPRTVLVARGLLPASSFPAPHARETGQALNTPQERVVEKVVVQERLRDPVFNPTADCTVVRNIDESRFQMVCEKK